MGDPSTANGAEVTPVGSRDTGVSGGPTLVFRPRLALRLTGPVLALIGMSVVATGSLLGVVLVALSGVVFLNWIPRVELDARRLRYRGIRAVVEIRLDREIELRLRRVSYGPPRPPHRVYRAGRFASAPIRLRVTAGEDRVQLTIAWWDGWPALVRALLTVPTVSTDSRTRGRLDRYG